MKAILPLIMIIELMGCAADSINAENKDSGQIIEVINTEMTLSKIYDEFYDGLHRKDTAKLAGLFDDSFELVHMTGRRQSKQEYLETVATGEIRYFSYTDTKLTLNVGGNSATIIGKSQVDAIVGHGSTSHHVWPLQLNISLKNSDGVWLMTKAVASTF